MTTWLFDHLRCPECLASPLKADESSLACPGCGAKYPRRGETPVLLRRDNELFPPADYAAAQVPAPAPRPWRRWLLPDSSINVSRDRVLSRHLFAPVDRDRHVLVVGAGTQREGFEAPAGGDPRLHLHYCDVDIRALVDCFGDLHDLPFVDGCFDGVIATAVLEHVMRPDRAVDEIHRVLRPEGLFYSEIPFMQQVHEGAYDFTRYSLSGHRQLLRRFHELDSGLVAGPGTALVWSMEHFASAFFPSAGMRRGARAMTRLLTFWLKYADYLVLDSPAAMDAASCTYILGAKRAGETSPADIVARYRGGRPLSHR
jgi:SAM-dependent methyltransferase